MDVLSLQEMVDRENAAFKSGITARALMEVAGTAMAALIRATYPHAAEFLVLVGKGNNGGDGLVVARHLIATGRSVRVVLTAPEAEMGELPRLCLDRLLGAHANLEITSWKPDLTFPKSDGVVIDALLGIQAKGPLRGDLARIVATLNEARAARFFRTVALDLPTGLAAYEEGEAPADKNAAVIADLTIAVGYAKALLCREALAGWVGRLEIAPFHAAEKTATTRQVLVPQELARLLPRRNALSHKNDFGRLAIVAGSRGFTGAPILCALAAQAMGTGLLCVVTHSNAADIVAMQSPHEAMVSGWPDGSAIPKVVEGASAIVIGPGLGTGKATLEMLRAVLKMGCPVLIDADALTVLADHLELLKEAKGPVLLTPHPGEMKRLIGRKFSTDEREKVAREFTQSHGVTLVLKGTRTLVAALGDAIFINTSGNPGLSTGGSGDTLSGILGALLAQGLTALDAARLGVWLHGHAADLVLAERGCEEGLTPTMLSAKLGAALVSLRAQAVPPPGLIELARDLGVTG